MQNPAERLRAHQRRATPQRRAILDAFKGGNDEHLSADEVHARASARVEGIGRGTVYATLADLSELGLIATIGDQDPVRYEANTAEHDHFRCRRCLRLFDVQLEAPSLPGLAGDGFDIEAVAVVAHGVCAECTDYARGLEDGAADVLRKRQLDEPAISELACIRHETPLGTLVMAATSDGIARVAFEDHADFEALAERARSRRGGRAARDRCAALIGSIDGYLDGSHEPLHDLVDWNAVGESGRESLEAVHDIAWGAHTSYHRVAGCAGHAYGCGHLMGANPIPLLIPCHRISCGQERARHYVGGEAARGWLDDLER